MVDPYSNSALLSYDDDSSTVTTITTLNVLHLFNDNGNNNWTEEQQLQNMQINATNITYVQQQQPQEYIFDKFYIRAIFITLYTIVFALCFFGNLLVILVVTISKKLQSNTNFFLANLAFADFSVAIFCIYQNLFIYIVENWVLGDFLCKMYMFIQSLSSTASIFILVVICTERYFAILYPITCRQILTSMRLRIIISGVWTLCILYSSPKFYWGSAVTVGTGDTTETLCILDRQLYNSEIFDMIHFVLFYVLPLGIMSHLYTKIAVCLWNSSQQLRRQLDASSNVNPYQALYPKSPNHQRNQKDSTALNGTSEYDSSSSRQNLHVKYSANSSHTSGSGGSPTCSEHVLRARRGVIKMLIVVVVAFAVCNLPIHVRKMWQYWSTNYHGGTNFSALLTPLTFLCSYFNSGVNPLLYAFLSKNFRRGMWEILFCSRLNTSSSSSTILRNRISLRQPEAIKGCGGGTGGGGKKHFHRHSSTRSTMRCNNATTVTMLHDYSSDEV